jgi:ATP-dependent Clp endopeptidase proteolytic subunit ClpP
VRFSGWRKIWQRMSADRPAGRKEQAVPDPATQKIAYLGYTGPIDSNGATRIASTINWAVNEQYECVYLCFNSPGGYVGDGIYLYHHIRALPVEVVMHNTGTVASIAATLFAAGHRRFCAPHSIFMMHPITVGGTDSMASEPLQAALDAALKDEVRTESILRERTRIPQEILTARRSRDIYLTADKALEYGLVDEIREFTLPAGNKIFQI